MVGCREFSPWSLGFMGLGSWWGTASRSGWCILGLAFIDSNPASQRQLVESLALSHIALPGLLPWL